MRYEAENEIMECVAEYMRRGRAGNIMQREMDRLVAEYAAYLCHVPDGEILGLLKYWRKVSAGNPITA